MSEERTAHMLISGRVQGVGFRYFVYKTANQLGLNGWVRNLHNGKVEVFFEGEEKLVRQGVDHCKIGPSSARVDKVNVEWDYPEQSNGNFSIRY